jgi:hypothetical protein
MTELTEKLDSTVPDRSVYRQPGPVLPSLQSLAMPPLLANGLTVALMLIGKHAAEAAAVAGGCGVGLLIYAALHVFTEKVFGTLFSRTGGVTTTAQGGLIAFGVFAGGKFILVGAIMYGLIAVLHLSIAAFIVGFIITQITVSVPVIKRLAETKITD